MVKDKEIKITIVGGGLSAIYAFWGAKDAGYDPYEIEVIKTLTPEPLGAVFMYECPISWKGVEVRSLLLGTAEGYAAKQWGDPTVQTSAHKRFALFSQKEEWLVDPREVMPVLWSMIPNIRRLGMQTQREINALCFKREAVICTFANPDIKHKYAEAGHLCNFNVAILPAHNPSYTVVYNGTEEIPWVRFTTFPHCSFAEYPVGYDSKKIYDDWDSISYEKITVQRVPDVFPDCPHLDPASREEGNLLRVGRMAVFDRHYLSHQARKDTENFLRRIA